MTTNKLKTKQEPLSKSNFLKPSWKLIALLLIIIFVLSYLGTMVFEEDSMFAYITNTLSGIGTAYFVICFIYWISLKKRKVAFLQNPWLTSSLSILTGLATNLIYCLAMIAVGSYNHSPWYFTVALYHAILALQKSFLGYSFRKHREDLSRAWHTYRLVAYLISAVSFALVATIILVISQKYHLNSGTNYAIAMAVYTFTIAITSFINTIQSRKLKHPLLVASRYVSLTSSLFSVFTLQTIMLQTFNTKNELDWTTTSLITGIAIFLIINVLALLMINQAQKNLKKMSS